MPIIEPDIVESLFCHHGEESFALDVGGEGRYPFAWNLNRSAVRTLNPNRGVPIPRLIIGRADDIPLSGRCVDLLIVERTPLRRASLQEMARVVKPHGTIVLRHAWNAHGDPHRLAYQLLAGDVQAQLVHYSNRWIRESVFRCVTDKEDRKRRI